MSSKELENQKKEKSNVLNPEDLYHLLISHWYWFVLSIAITMSFGVYKIMITPPTYTRTVDLLLKDDKNDNNITMRDFRRMGIAGSSPSMNNEIQVISAINTLQDVVQRLHLDVQTTVSQRLRERPLYNDSPIILDTNRWPAQSSFYFKIKILDNSHYLLYDIQNSDKRLRAEFGKTIIAPFGVLSIDLSPVFTKSWIGKDITVHKYRLSDIAKLYASRLKVTQKNPESSILSITITDESPERADEILNTLIEVYNDNWMADKNKIAEATSQFIESRLATIAKDLGNVDNNIANFKSRNLMPDVASAGAMYMGRSEQNYTAMLELRNQMAMMDLLKGFIRDTSKKNQILPANAVSNSGIESQIEEYNQLLLTRNDLVKNSSENSSVVKDCDLRLSQYRNAILRTLQNSIAQLKTQLQGFQQSENITNSKIASSPQLEKQLASITRKQDVTQKLYIFLLQKREENELSKAFTASNTRIIQPPYGSDSPTAPQKKNILLMAFLIGLAIPAVIIVIKELLNKTVRGKMDLEHLTIPLVGELPDLETKKHWWNKKTKQQRKIVVESGNRDMINEAFRILRTKLNYFTNTKVDNGKAQIIMVTSYNPGSGKTFITSNLATTFGLSGKKVLVVDMDIRRCSLSKMLNAHHKVGVTDYLSNMNDNLDELIIKDAFGKGIDVLPSGMVPPNPTELLSSDRVKSLFDSIKEEYDCIFLDCPPIEIVADATIIKSYADITMFIVRVGVMDRRALDDIEELYKDGTYNNMTILLNGVDYVSGRYRGYHYGYSYRYGRYNYNKGDGYYN